MRDLDRMIDEAIGEEERELLRRMGEEPNFVVQALGIFGGSTGWVNAVLMAVQTLMFIAGAGAAWMFFAADDAVAQLRWGLPGAVLLLMAVITKMTAWSTLQANRVLRELKLIELQFTRQARQLDRSTHAVDGR
jgi:hypothetical protein